MDSVRELKKIAAELTADEESLDLDKFIDLNKFIEDAEKLNHSIRLDQVLNKYINGLSAAIKAGRDDLKPAFEAFSNAFTEWGEMSDSLRQGVRALKNLAK